MTNLCLTSMRFRIAALKAVFHGERLVRKKKQVLFAELFKALNDFGLDLRKGEAVDNTDKEAITEPVDIEEPPSLIDAMIPKKIETVKVRTAKELEDVKAAHQLHMDAVLGGRPKRRRKVETYGTKTLGDLICADWVYYTSTRAGEVLNAHVLRHNENGTIDLNIKKNAQPGNIDRPEVKNPVSVQAAAQLRKVQKREERKALRKAKKAAAAAFDKPSGSQEAPSEIWFAGAKVLGWRWDADGPCWEVDVERDGGALVRMVWPEDWPYADPPGDPAQSSDEGTDVGDDPEVFGDWFE